MSSCYPEPTNGFKVIALGNRKSADWCDLASASTSRHLIQPDRPDLHAVKLSRRPVTTHSKLRKVKKSIHANSRIKATALKATAANPAQIRSTKTLDLHQQNRCSTQRRQPQRKVNTTQAPCPCPRA